MKIKWTPPDSSCIFSRSCGLDPCEGLTTCPEGGEAPLFVPLAKRWYIEFREGRKDTEFRPAEARRFPNGDHGKASPWNERTCRVGRPALLSNGYQVSGRLHAVVAAFRVQDDAPPEFDEIYPGHRARGGLVAAITFRVLP